MQVDDDPYSTTITLENLEEFKDLIDRGILTSGDIYTSDDYSEESLAIACDEDALKIYYILSDLKNMFDNDDFSFIDLDEHLEATGEHGVVDLELLFQNLCDNILW